LLNLAIARLAASQLRFVYKGKQQLDNITLYQRRILIFLLNRALLGEIKTNLIFILLYKGTHIIHRSISFGII
jgi:hypothetical protein